MDSWYKSGLERKGLHSKENYSTKEPGDMEFMISDVSGGPERA